MKRRCADCRKPLVEKIVHGQYLTYWRYVNLDQPGSHGRVVDLCEVCAIRAGRSPYPMSVLDTIHYGKRCKRAALPAQNKGGL